MSGSATFAGEKASIDASNGYKFTSSTGAFGQINGDGIYQMQTDGSTVGAQILANEILPRLLVATSSSQAAALFLLTMVATLLVLQKSTSTAMVLVICRQI